jgi:hypothetical protein
MKKAFLVLALSLGLTVSAQSPTYSIQVTPRNVDCGEAQVGQWSTFESYFIIKNTGKVAVATNNVSNNAQFDVQNSGCGLLPGQSCTVAVTFKPSALGLRSGVVTVTKLEDQQSVSVNVTGEGIQ